MATEITLTCHTRGCTNTYTTTTRRVAHYCPRCREVRKRRKQALVKEARAEAVNRARDAAEDKLTFDAEVRRRSDKQLDELMGMRTLASWTMRLPDYVSSEEISEDDPLCLLPERQPAGTHTNWGPIDERSQHSTQLASVKIDLDYRQNLLMGKLCNTCPPDQECYECRVYREAERWFAENPHWMLEPDPPRPAAEECGERKGTRAGYLRHKKAGEDACPECAAANRDYIAHYRSVCNSADLQ